MEEISNGGLAKIIDIESSSLLETMLDHRSFPYKLHTNAKLHVVVIRDAYTDEVFVAKGKEITKEWIKASLKGCKFLIHHNGVKFDLITLKLFGVLDYTIGYLDEPDTLFGEEVTMIDTVILSRLFNPDRFGGHSLESWGERTGASKMDFRGELIKQELLAKDAPKGAEFENLNDVMVEYCITPDMRLLDQQLQWKKAEEYAIGDIILGFDEESKETRMGRRYKNSQIKIIKEDFAEVFEVLLESGKILKVTADHKFLVARKNHGHNQYFWTETKNLRPKNINKTYYSSLPCLFPIYEQDLSFDSGWLSGMFDGEGCLSTKNDRYTSLSIAQRPTKTLEKIERLFKEFDINSSRRLVRKDGDCVALKINGGLSEIYRTLCLFRPERLISKFDFDTLGRVEVKNRGYNDDILSITSIGIQKILKIQTSTNTFICEGYPMHNCTMDTLVNKNAFFALMEEKEDYKGWDRAIKMEHKLADLAVRRESLGFWFDKELAIKCVEDLTNKMEDLRNKVNPILPSKPMTKGELSMYTAPATQFLKSGKPSTHIIKFAERIGGKILEKEINEKEKEYYIEFEEQKHKLPYNLPLKSHTEADISNLDHVKMTLTDVYSWIPQEWAERDFTKDSKKQSLPYEKRIIAFDRWLLETMSGKYTKLRLGIAYENFKVKSFEQLEETIYERLKQDFPVRLPTSPKVRVGVEKDLCPNLIRLGDKVGFANDFALYLTYKHRKSSIAGGEIEDMDFAEEVPNSGFLSMYREEDGRVSTPAIEIGANTSRYRHIGICNIARPTSVYGKELRSLFGSGADSVFYGFDFASIEARIMAHYVYDYTDGIELGKAFVAEKPNDLHCYSEDTEILTKEGWKTFDSVTTETEVAQFLPENKKAEWVKPFEVVWQDYEGDMIHIKNSNTDQLLTPQHRVYTENTGINNGKVDLAESLLNYDYSDRRFLCGATISNSLQEENNWFLKLLIATQADGCLAKDCSAIQFSFTKQNKVDRLKNILENLDAKYSYHEHFRKGRFEKCFRLNATSLTVKIREYLTLNKELDCNLLSLSTANRQTIINELQYWDGTVGKSGVIIDITCKKTIDVLQSLCASLGIKSTITQFNKKIKETSILIYRLYISKIAKCTAGIHGALKEKLKYKGKVGCVSVPSTFIIVRRNGKVFVSGNTKMAEVMNVPRPDAKSINYGIIYGAAWKKIQKMTGKSDQESKDIVDGFWGNAVALKEFRDKAVGYWEITGKKFVPAIDGRKIFVRSPHSILNALFQSAAVVYAKYVAVLLMEQLEKTHHLCIDPFIAKPQACSMIEYHDEIDMFTDPKLFEFKRFEEEQEAKDFIKNWQGEQLSAIGHSSKGYYICLPNVISTSTTQVMRKIEQQFKVKVPMGFEYMLGRTWYDCH